MRPPASPPRWPLLILALLLLATLAPGPTLAQTPATGEYAADDLLAIAPDQRHAVAASLPSGLTTYDIALTIPATDADLSLHGEATIRYTNTTGEPLDALPFRLYANSAADNHDAVTIDSATVDGTSTTPELSVDNSVATLPLPRTLDPGTQAEVRLSFTTTPDRDTPRHYGIFNYTTDTRTWSLAHWYPVVAGRDPHTGWMLEPTSIHGDPIFTDTALYTIEITAPAGMHLITSGVETDRRQAGDAVTTTFNAWPSRDVVIIASPTLQALSGKVGDTTVTSWFEPGDDLAGQQVLEWGMDALALFNDLLGTYPWQQLQIVSAEIYGAAGVEFPQLVTVDRGYYRAIQPSTWFEFTVAHEVVHQWFFNLVGNNQYAHAFIDESITNYLSSEIYFSRVHDRTAANAIVHHALTRPFENAVRSGNDAIVDHPTDTFPSMGSYSAAIYSKGPLGFAAIHDAMGDDAFFAALRSYVDDFSFRVASPNDLLAAFEQASDKEIRPIWTHWFRERNGALDVGR